jgi:hypothetical protein
MHLPRGAVEIKMRVEGVDVSILDLDPDSPSPNQPQQSSTPPPLLPVVKIKDDPLLAKYFKVRSGVEGWKFGVCSLISLNLGGLLLCSNNQMLSMHLPRAAVEIKMRVDGVDVSILDMDPESPSPNQPLAFQAQSGAAAQHPVLKIKDDPLFAKYFKVHRKAFH